MTPLQPERLPLHGSRLIEASAGTGKTWTIAALYLRLVLGHGGDAAFARPLQPAEILVMTFTVAATRELSDRIRRRLVEAARAFRAEAAGDDALLNELIAAHQPGAERRHAAWRLEMAAQAMDDAAVHTIDAWCQRLLREHAFDSGSLFDEELSPDESVIRREAAHDYWRLQVYPLQGAALDAVLEVWPDASRLADEARQLVEQDWPADAGESSLGERVERLLRQRNAELAELKQGWAERAQQMANWLERQLGSAACPFNKRMLGARNCQRWLDALADWAADPMLEDPALTDTARKRLTPAGIDEALKPGEAIDLPPEFDAFDELMTALAARAPLAASLRPHAAASIAARIAELKQQAGRFGFADMLNRLDRALDPASNGDSAHRLRDHIVERYPVAMIDEFQDTSPVQLRIFDRLYRIADNDRSTALLLIGDPKQSIYRFRGADIHSYLDARRKTEGRHHLLTTNHRSSAPLVAAVNHLFSQAEARIFPAPRQEAMQGAFIYGATAEPSRIGAEAPPTTRTLSAEMPVGGASAPISNPVPFVAVDARGRSEQLLDSTGSVAAMQLVLESGAGDAAGIRRRFAQRCAERIATLLNDQRAGFDDPEKGFVRLRPADIAVLVRTGREAQAVRRELQRRRVASVYLSDQDSVFASAEAADLLRWLRAVAQPLDTRLVRAALATRTIGLPVAELRRLAIDDEAFDERSEQIAGLHQVWQAQGVLTMLRRSLHLFELPSRWLAEPAAGDDDSADDGERRLTNYLHLAELLQAASANLDGEQALIRWLAAQIDDAAAARDEEQIVRLESDADLVQVITVHKSKGLEYPLVFLPFASGFRPVEKGRGLLFVDLVDEASGERRIHLDPTAEQVEAADLDRQREDMRLLYVALTRARHALWVGLAAQASGKAGANSWHRSAAGRLLGDGQPVDADVLPGQLAALLAGRSEIELQIVASDEPVGCSLLVRRDTQPPLRELPDYAAQFERGWHIASFSAMVRDLPPAVTKLAADAQLHDDETAVAEAADAQQTGRDGAVLPATADLFADEPWHQFPRGAVPGNFLHAQLEWLAGEGFDLSSNEPRQQLLRRCERQGWGQRGQAVLDWLGVVVQTPLPVLGSSLDAITTLLPEMEFWFGSDGVAVERIDALCQTHLLQGRARPPLPRRELLGMLMGFADLVFEHDGRYWVLDYKSNRLGDGDAAYSPDALEAAMASHRYDVQAAIYLLALHRLLRRRLGSGYEPARQLGGAVYLFLRGINGPTRGCHVVEPAIEWLDRLDALLSARPEDRE
ncbi:exodeoxyribonuclease V subunit beta [Piscinibacter sakaiensis]|uniref:exodeoxyribonuclease V subunit beta n=1 Tax=Piscinibacter sakaiensis TaxID=1547922 RepID=UPI003AAD6930